MFNIRSFLYALYWHATFFRSRNRVFGRYRNYREAYNNCQSDYSNEELIDIIYKANKKVATGRSLYERDGVNYDEIHYSHQLNMHLLKSAYTSLDKGKGFKILDFGGALGTTYRQFPVKKVLEKWTVIEQPKLVNIGAKEFSCKRLNFCTSDMFFKSYEREYDAVIFSAVIDYIEDYRTLMRRIISESKAKIILIDRSLFSELDVDFYAIKKTNKNITGNKKYPVCILSEKSFKVFMAEMDLRWQTNGQPAMERW